MIRRPAATIVMVVNAIPKEQSPNLMYCDSSKASEAAFGATCRDDYARYQVGDTSSHSDERSCANPKECRFPEARDGV
jgi:hypothetical protein